jgi:hypothetical protein
MTQSFGSVCPSGPTTCWATSGRTNSEDPVVATDFQVGGHFCHHRLFFGLKFHVPRNDPLAVLAHTYLESDHPGPGNPDYTTPLEEIVLVKERLARLGLELDPIHYAYFSEAYIPVSGRSAWDYAISRELAVFTAPVAHKFETTDRLDFLGLGQSWEEAVEYLKAFWESNGGRTWFLTREPWTAAVHYPNCD